MDKAERDIFGDSDDSDQELLKDFKFSDDEDNPQLNTQAEITTETLQSLPSFRKGSKKKARTPKAAKQQEPAMPLDPEEQKILEAQLDVDAAVEKVKPRKRRMDLQQETEADEMIQAMIEKMQEAVETDVQLNELKQPAIAKLKLLPVIEEQLQKSHLRELLIDNGVLNTIRLWLEPARPEGKLPALDIQRSMLLALLKFNVHPVHLRESGVGKIVNFYSKYSQIPEIKKIAVKLVGSFISTLDRWMRQIINRSDKYKDQKVETAEYDPTQVTLKVSPSASQKVSTAIMHRARIPASVAKEFTVAPKSSISIQDRSKAGDPYRKLKQKMMSIKRRV